MSGKLQICQNGLCGQQSDINDMKSLVIPLIEASPTGMHVKMTQRWLCGQCYDDYFYFLTEEWDAQKPEGERQSPPPTPSARIHGKNCICLACTHRDWGVSESD